VTRYAQPATRIKSLSLVRYKDGEMKGVLEVREAVIIETAGLK
jgi:hypothetical protein